MLHKKNEKSTTVELNPSLNNSMKTFFAAPASGALAALILIFIVMSIASGSFLSGTNMVNIVRQAAILAIISIGQTMVFISGTFDLSVAAMASMSTVIVTQLITTDATPWVPVMLLCLAVGAVMGFINGFMVAAVRIPPMIATLAAATIYEGISLTITQGYGTTLPSGNPVAFLGRGNIGPIPVLGIIMILLYVIFHFVMKKTKLGRIIYGLGGNQEAVRLSGISVVKSRIIIYVICGVLVAFAGFLLTARISSGHPTAAAGMQMDSVAATLMGGAKVTGGVGNLGGTMCGVLILTIISNGLNMAGINPYIQLVCKGVIMAVAVGISTMRKK